MEQTYLKSIRENWMILVFVGGVIGSWVMFDSRLTSAEAKIIGFETTSEQIKQIQIDVAVISVKTEVVQSDIQEIKRDIKQALAR